LPRTDSYKPLIASLFLFLANPHIGHADPSLSARDTIIQKQMDCVSNGLKVSGVGWQDVCDIPDQGQGDKIEAVNRQLDEFSQQNFPGLQQDAKKIFPSSMQHDSDKVFSDPQKPDRQSAKALLKGIISPSLMATAEHQTTSNVRTRVNTFDVGSEIFYYRFVMPHVILEPIVGSATQNVPFKDVGPMYGFYANYAYRPPAGNFLNNPLTNVYFLQGSYDISNELSFSGQGNLNHEHNTVTELRGLIGKDYAVGANVMVTPYFGYGYRYLNENNDGKVTSIGYWMNDRKSHYYYLPLGSNAAFNMPNDWEIDLNAELDIVLSAMQKNYYSDWDKFSSTISYPDVSFHQSHGVGVRGSVKFIKKGSLVDFYVEPYFRFWNFDNSKTIIWYNGSAVGEPYNTTFEIGSKFGVQF
jgi:hypothetical protein